MTFREIGAIHDALEARDMRADFYSARVVAMLVAVNSKRHQYKPINYMLNKKAVEQQINDRPKAREPLTGEQVMARFAALGVRIIDRRGIQ